MKQEYENYMKKEWKYWFFFYYFKEAIYNCWNGLNKIDKDIIIVSKEILKIFQ